MIFVSYHEYIEGTRSCVWCCLIFVGGESNKSSWSKGPTESCLHLRTWPSSTLSWARGYVSPDQLLSLNIKPFFIFYVSLFSQKITLEDLSDSKSYIEEKSTGELSRSVNSMATATHETSNVAVYEVILCVI